MWGLSHVISITALPGIHAVNAFTACDRVGAAAQGMAANHPTLLHAASPAADFAGWGLAPETLRDYHTNWEDFSGWCRGGGAIRPGRPEECGGLTGSQFCAAAAQLSRRFCKGFSLRRSDPSPRLRSSG